MFVDASAIVAILTREPEADALADVLQSASSPVTSPIAMFEAVLGICRKRLLSVEQAEEHVQEFLKLASVESFQLPRRTRRQRFWPSLDTARGAAIRRGSTSATALPTQ